MHLLALEYCCEHFLLMIDSYKQTLFVVWGNFILFISYLILNFEISLLLISFVMMYVFGGFSEIGIHRFFTHKSFQTTRLKEHILKAFAFLAGQGAIMSWVTVHRYHHAYEDTPKDPHTPFHHSKLRIILGLYPTKYSKHLVVDLLRHKDSKYFIFENKYYWLMWSLLWVVSYLISPLFFFCIVSGSAMWYLATCAVNIINHGSELGFKKYPDAVARNIWWMNILTAIGNHNNHHKHPEKYSYRIDDEIDLYGTVIKYCFEHPQSVNA